MPELPDPQRGLENRLLAALPSEAYEQLIPSLELVSMSLKQIIFQPNGAIEHIYFPLSCIISLVIRMQDGQAVEVATVGNEGMVGLPVFLGAETFAGQAFIQVPGESIRMERAAFQNEVTSGGSFQDILHCYTQALFTQIAQSAACNRLHTIEQRCARWLLMTQDRVRADDFELTQEFLSQMLGVRRASVSEVASRLQKAQFIEYSRGHITVLDRPRLEAAACECYTIITHEYDRLFSTS